MARAFGAGFTAGGGVQAPKNVGGVRVDDRSARAHLKQTEAPQAFISFSWKSSFAPPLAHELRAALAHMGLHSFLRAKMVHGHLDFEKLLRKGVALKELLKLEELLRDVGYLERIPHIGADAMDSRWREMDKSCRKEFGETAGPVVLLELQRVKEDMDKAELRGGAHFNDDQTNWEVSVAVEDCQLFIALIDEESVKPESGCPTEWATAMKNFDLAVKQGGMIGAHHYSFLPILMPDISEATMSRNRILREVLGRVPHERCCDLSEVGLTNRSFEEMVIPATVNNVKMCVRRLIHKGLLAPNWSEYEPPARFPSDPDVPVGTWVIYQNPRRNAEGYVINGKVQTRVKSFNEDDGTYNLEFKERAHREDFTLAATRKGMSQRQHLPTKEGGDRIFHYASGRGPDEEEPLVEGGGAGFSTELEHAVDIGDFMNVKRLVQAKCDVNQRSPGSLCTPCHWAAARGHENTVSYLLLAKALPDLQDRTGNSPLHLACSNLARCSRADPVGGYVQSKAVTVVKTLLEAGADANITNLDCQPPIYYAEEDRVAGLLRAFGGHRMGGIDGPETFGKKAGRQALPTSLRTATMEAARPPCEDPEWLKAQAEKSLRRR